VKNLKMVSWNVNGLRAVRGKGFLEWIGREDPDVVCLQETKADREQVPSDLREISGYYAYFVGAQRKGYSGVALWTRQRPKKLETTLGIKRFDAEGRMIRADYPGFTLLNVYFPNGGASHERLLFKLDFYDTFLHYLGGLKTRKVVLCGDFNTAHREIDLARPKENSNRSGFLPQERAWLDRLLDRGFLDTFRLYSKEGGRYTWWDYQTRARERNVGWRIDYFFITTNLRRNLTAAFIQSDVLGSDHCPVGIHLKL
jgi:exodeoxyribonuclease-3